jgi:hypothetical protein
MTKGWVKVGQGCGRYAYRKVWVHITNPDHCEPKKPEALRTQLDTGAWPDSQ